MIRYLNCSRKRSCSPLVIPVLMVDYITGLSAQTWSNEGFHIPSKHPAICPTSWSCGVCAAEEVLEVLAVIEFVRTPALLVARIRVRQRNHSYRRCSAFRMPGGLRHGLELSAVAIVDFGAWPAFKIIGQRRPVVDCRVHVENS